MKRKATYRSPGPPLSNEWGTPAYILNALGPFDSDPCDGKTWHKQPFIGLVWLNPPYGRQLQVWLQELANHNHGIALVFARTDTAWFHELVFQRAKALLFLRGRVAFEPLAGQPKSGSPFAPSVLVAYGDEAMKRLKTSALAGVFLELVPKEETVA
jgi:hypothetical protein